MSNIMMVKKMVRGGLTLNEADELMDKLEKRSEREIIEDLKQIDIKSLKNTESELERYLETLYEQKGELDETIEQVELSLDRINTALNEGVEELLNAEKIVNDILRFRFALD